MTDGGGKRTEVTGRLDGLMAGEDGRMEEEDEEMGD